MKLEQLLPKATSTNALALQAAHEGAEHGSWICALEQSAGVGQQMRPWVSPLGNLYLSMIFHFPANPHLAILPLAFALRVGEFLNHKFQINVKLKWPNDLMIDHKKCAGFLCQGFSQGPLQVLVVGLGLNIKQAPNTTQAATYLQAHCTKLIEEGALRQEIIEQLTQEAQKWVHAFKIAPKTTDHKTLPNLKSNLNKAQVNFDSNPLQADQCLLMPPALKQPAAQVENQTQKQSQVQAQAQMQAQTQHSHLNLSQTPIENQMEWLLQSFWKLSQYQRGDLLQVFPKGVSSPEEKIKLARNSPQSHPIEPFQEEATIVTLLKLCPTGELQVKNKNEILTLNASQVSVRAF